MLDQDGTAESAVQQTPALSSQQKKRRPNGLRFTHLREEHWIGSPASLGKTACTPTGEHLVQRRQSESNVATARKPTILESLVGAADPMQADLRRSNGDYEHAPEADNSWFLGCVTRPPHSATIAPRRSAIFLHRRHALSAALRNTARGMVQNGRDETQPKMR